MHVEEMKSKNGGLCKTNFNIEPWGAISWQSWISWLKKWEYLKKTTKRFKKKHSTEHGLKTSTLPQCQLLSKHKNKKIAASNTTTVLFLNTYIKN